MEMSHDNAQKRINLPKWKSHVTMTKKDAYIRYISNDMQLKINL